MTVTGQLDPAAVQKVSGPSFDAIRETILELSRILLSVSPEAASELTTIYVKFGPDASMATVHAVMWIKASNRVIIGLSLPPDVESPHFCPEPKGTRYKGITKHLILKAGDPIPDEFGAWATLAHAEALKAQARSG